MYRLAVFQKDNAQGAIAHLLDARPSAYATISLTFFPQRMPHDLLDPLIPDDGTVRARPSVEEGTRGLHAQHSYTFSTSSP